VSYREGCPGTFRASARIAAGDITQDEKSALVTVAAQSDVGHRAHPPEDADAGEPDFNGAISDECPD
jgi:hypothetical protein